MEKGYDIYHQNIHENDIKIFFLNPIGPKLPVGLIHSTMISSPTGMGVMMIGGRTKLNPMFPDILELSGDSKETLEWKTLDQKIQYPRIFHLSVSISNDIAANLTMKSIGSSLQN